MAVAPQSNYNVGPIMARPLTPEYIASIAPYVPGKPIKEVEREYGIKGALKLASNENCLGASPRAVAAMREALPEVWLYPESTCPYLRPKLAERLGVTPDRLSFGDGSHELLEVAVRAFVEPGEEVLTSSFTFAIYRLAAAVAGRTYVEVPIKDMTYDLEALAAAINPKTKLIFIANPNNPTGTIVRRREMEAFLARVPEDVVVVVDEAYFEFVRDPDYPESLRWHDGKRRLLTMRTFSKAYGLAGLRIGYAVGRADMIAAMEKVRPAFNVGSLAQVAAEAALDDHDFLKRSRAVVHAGIDLVTPELQKLGVKVWPSQTNFVFADVSRPANDFFEAMVKRGVIVRPVGPTHLRITVGTEEMNRAMLAAARAVLQG